MTDERFEVARAAAVRGFLLGLIAAAAVQKLASVLGG
jgi:hypothetical protein